MQLPDYNFLSAPPWLITVLHILTLTLHFVAMNFLVGGIIIVLWGKFQNRWEDPTVKTFARLFPVATAATVTLGVAPLLFVQLVYGRQVYSASIVSGWFWMMIIPAVILSYYFFYGAASVKETVTPWRKQLYLTLGLIGLFYVSLVYSSVFSMAERPATIASLYGAQQSGLAWNTDIGDYFLRWLHMILGAITVGGFFIGLLSRDNPGAFKVGKGFFLWGMVSAAVAGFAYLFTLGDHLVPFMRTPGIWALTLGILLSAGSLHFFFKKRFIMSGLMVFVSMLTMVISRHYVRLIKLQPQFDPATVRVDMQWSPFLLFVICFVVALAVVGYMLRLFFTAKKTEKAEPPSVQVPV